MLRSIMLLILLHQNIFIKNIDMCFPVQRKYHNIMSKFFVIQQVSNNTFHELEWTRTCLFQVNNIKYCSSITLAKQSKYSEGIVYSNKWVAILLLLGLLVPCEKIIWIQNRQEKHSWFIKFSREIGIPNWFKL